MKKEDLYIILDMTEETIYKIIKKMFKEKYTNGTDIAKMMNITYDINKIKRHYKPVKKK